MVQSYRPGEERAATQGCLSKLLHMMVSVARVSILPFSVSFFIWSLKWGMIIGLQGYSAAWNQAHKLFGKRCFYQNTKDSDTPLSRGRTPGYFTYLRFALLCGATPTQLRRKGLWVLEIALTDPVNIPHSIGPGPYSKTSEHCGSKILSDTFLLQVGLSATHPGRLGSGRGQAEVRNEDNHEK